MAESFKNPANGYVETVDGASAAWVILFGGLYLVYRGLWAHALIWLVVVGMFGAISGPFAIVVALATGILYGFQIQSILAKKYLRRGWSKVDVARVVKAPDLKTNNFMSPHQPTLAEPAHKVCPFCAETVLAAAIKCKHCGSELTPGPVPVVNPRQTFTEHFDEQGARVLGPPHPPI